MKQSEKQERTGTSAIGSITGLLKQIYEESVSTNDILQAIEVKLDDTFEYSQMSISGILNNQIINNGLIFKQTNFLSQINYGIFSLTAMVAEALDSLGDFDFVKRNNRESAPTSNISLEPVLNVLNDIKNLLFGYFKKAGYTHQETTQKPEENDLANQLSTVASNLINNSLLSDNINQSLNNINASIFGTNNSLEQILDTVKGIYLFLPSLSGKESGELGGTVKQRTNEFVKLVQSFSGFKKVLTKNFLKDLDTFVTLYEKFIEEKNTKKLIAISFNLSKFTIVLTMVSKMLEAVKSIFNGLTTAIVLLTVVLILPPFQLGFAYLVGMVKMLKVALGGSKDSLLMVIAMRKLALSVTLMVGAMYLLGKIPFGNVFKLIVFLAGLAGVMRLFQKKSPTQSVTSSVSKKYGVTGIFSAAIGIAILVITIDLASNLDFGKAVGLITFIGGLAMVLFIFNRKKIGKSGPLDSLAGLSIGLSILLLVIDACGAINFAAALSIFGFIIGLGMAIMIANKMMGGTGGGKFNVKMGMNVGMKGMFGFALGVAILILTIDAANELNWIGAIQLLGFIAALGVAVAAPQLLSKGKMNGKPMGGMIGFSIGVALLLLTIDAAAEVNFTAGWKMIGVMVGIVGVMILMKRMIGPPKLVTIQIGLFAASIIAISGALYVASLVHLEIKQILTLGLCTVLMLGITYLISKMGKQVTLATGLMPFFVGSMLALSGLMAVISNINVSFEQVGMFVVSALTVVGLCWLVGKIGVNLILGAGILLAVSSAGLVAAIAVKKIGEAQITLDTIIGFVGTVALITAMCFGLSFIGVPIAIGSAVLIAVGIAMLTVAYGFKLISDMDIKSENIDAFMVSVSSLAVGFAMLLPQLLMSVPSAALAVALGIATIITAGALLMVSEMKINITNVNLFGSSIISLVNSYDKIGLLAAGKAVVKATLILPLVAVTLLAAVAIRAIAGLNIPKTSMENFGVVLNDFLTYTTDAINSSLDKIKAVEPGLEALSKLVSVAGQLVTVIQSYADMKIGVWKYNKATGQMEIVEYKKIDEPMLASVGTGIGTILQALIRPLSIISGDGDTWDFGNGVIVKNPFKGGWFGTDNNSGAKRIELIGNSFSSLVDVIKGLSDNKLLLGGEGVDFGKFNANFIGFITMLSCSVSKVQAMNLEGIDKRASSLGLFFDSLKKFDLAKNYEETSIKELMNDLSDAVKWKKINSHLEATNKNISQIVGNINKIDITKALALEKNLKLLSESKTNEGIRECIDNLKELIGIIVEQQEKQTQAQAEISTTFKSAFGETNPLKPVTNKDGKPLTPEESKNNMFQQLVQQLQQALTGIDTKLSGKLKVQIVDSNGGNWMGKQ